MPNLPSNTKVQQFLDNGELDRFVGPPKRPAAIPDDLQGGVQKWLRHMYDVTIEQGVQLIHLSPKSTTDAPARADSAIKRLEAAGWIIRGKHSPGRDLQFFGFGGGPLRGAYPIEYMWSPNYDSIPLKNYLGIPIKVKGVDFPEEGETCWIIRDGKWRPVPVQVKKK